MRKWLDRLRRAIWRQQSRREAPSRRELDARRSARQQFFEATRNVGVIVLATCFTAGKIITNPSVNTDNAGWGALYGLGLILIGCIGYAFSQKRTTSDE